MFHELNEIQTNVLIASIIADGELTKLYKNSRRKNNSYREHYGEKQKEYREWKVNVMNGLFYITPKSYTLRSASSPFFTCLYEYFYNCDGHKTLPHTLISECTLPEFLAVLYMDDGSLCITKRINHNKKKIYLTPQIYLYLQNYPSEELNLLNIHIKNTFQINLHLAKRKDGYGTILRTTSVQETFAFLDIIKEVTLDCPSMFYKTNWKYRYRQEEERLKSKFPNYEIVLTSSNRYKNYSSEETERLILLKKQGQTDKEIAETLGRSYWSVVYKLSELRKMELI
ncbi:DNA endonuclease [Neobacillus jeddahensis]|uniref:DNA endonuclease n=1 Tax=Neobacillus jeddahensis TaxID=1461580 RepID=UPI00058DEFA0|nr:DNA endonuclease [Neobacillus jeddahensis]